jgi:hypothetical protein
MRRQVPTPPAMGVLAAAMLSLLAGACASENVRNYRFEVVNQPVGVGAHSEFDVKMTRAPGDVPVANATIGKAALTMTMDGSAPHKTAPYAQRKSKMGGEVKLLRSPAPGLYRFLGDVSMPGTWPAGSDRRGPRRA